MDLKIFQPNSISQRKQTQIALQYDEKHPGSIFMDAAMFMLAALSPQAGFGFEIFRESVDRGSCEFLLAVTSPILLFN